MYIFCKKGIKLKKNKLSFVLILSSFLSAFQVDKVLSCDQNRTLWTQVDIISPTGDKVIHPVYNDGLTDLGDIESLKTLTEAPAPFDNFPDSKLISVSLPLFPYKTEDVFMKPESRRDYEHWAEKYTDKKHHWGLKSYGYLTLPEGDGPCPGVILRHGSEGCNPFFYLLYAELLKQQGIASFLFSPDCLHHLLLQECTAHTSDVSAGTATDQLSVPIEQTILATFGAAEILATHPRIVGQKIGLIGWSRGGTDVLDCLSQQHQKYLNPSVHFSAGISFYPFPIFHEPDTLTAPLLVLLGEEDDYTPIAPVLRYLEMLTGDKTIEIYPHAGHSFDHALESLDPDQIEEKYDNYYFQNFSNLYFNVTRNEEGARTFTSPVYEEILTSESLLIFVMTHMEMGATSHYNCEAGKKAKEAIVSFMKRHLFE